MLRIPVPIAMETLQHVLRGRGFTAPRAATCARLFVEATIDGIASHGLNRFSRFIGRVDGGIVIADAEPVLVAGIGAIPDRVAGLHCAGCLEAGRPGAARAARAG